MIVKIILHALGEDLGFTGGFVHQKCEYLSERRNRRLGHAVL